MRSTSKNPGVTSGNALAVAFVLHRLRQGGLLLTDDRLDYRQVVEER
jgi:hypothetical protein